MSVMFKDYFIWRFEDRIKAALECLLLSQAMTHTGGSAANWSLLSGWGKPYPETAVNRAPSPNLRRDYIRAGNFMAHEVLAGIEKSCETI